ncbi:hypothetical protein C461_05342 [Halorubrum aidingense JCM 13560]|uniref:Uncharacterized protein n=1 Tax=Halorubrum aidingense JCM 13560 TaxID=1230454 RepID=M0PHH1_9EURY|nr:hypothetical protein [Halorubrum aidingense]EMA69029.1 hypothetical protein C461_05342 [Halorubrum aidingense JCM 13560]
MPDDTSDENDEEHAELVQSEGGTMGSNLTSGDVDGEGIKDGGVDSGYGEFNDSNSDDDRDAETGQADYPDDVAETTQGHPPDDMDIIDGEDPDAGRVDYPDDTKDDGDNE